MRRRLTDEECRILLAVQERRLFRNKHDRFEIDGEERPNRKARESLCNRRLIVSIYGNDGYRITATGRAELDAEIRARVAATRAETQRLQVDDGLSFAEAYERAAGRAAGRKARG